MVEWFFPVVDPDTLDHALIEGGRGQTRHVLGFVGRDRTGDTVLRLGWCNLTPGIASPQPADRNRIG
jgi:hypothetical protein